VIGVNIEHSGKVINRLLYLACFLICTSSDIEGPRVPRINAPLVRTRRGEDEFHKRVGVLNGFLEVAILEVVRRSEEEGFLVGGVQFELFGAGEDQVVCVQGLCKGNLPADIKSFFPGLE